MESKKINQLATNLAPTTSDLTVVGDPVNGELKKITLLQIASLFGAGLTSVGMVVPSGFSVTPSTLTSSGTFTITGAGSALQYIDGTGALQNFPTILDSERLIHQVHNNSGATISKGTIVYINGALGNKPTIAKALATGDATSAQTYGVVQNDISNNANGYLVVIGDVENLDTSAVVEGTQLYLSGTTAGAYTATKPYAPTHIVYVAIVLRSHPTLGIIGVKIQNGYEMDELHNVSAQSPANNDGLFYNTTTSLWEKNTIAGVLGYTPVTSARTINTTSPLSGGGDLTANRTLSIAQATTSVNGYLSSTDWNTFNNKQSIITLTTTGSSGASTFVTNTLNIPTYTLAGLGGQASSTNLTSLSGLTYVSASFVKMTAAGTFSLDTSTYLTANQTITLSGDISGSGTTAITTAIGTNKVTNAMLAQIATGTFHGRVTAGTGNVETLTGTQATTLLDVFSSTLKGLAPASGGGTTNFLRADGTWAAPATGGTGTVTSVGMTVPTGLSIAGTPITTSGTLALTFAAGYSIPTTTSQTNWDTAYTNRITSLTTTGSSGASTLTTNTLNIPNYTLAGLGGQPLATNLTSLAALTFVSTSFVKMTASGTFALDTTIYTSNTGTVTSVAALTLGTTGTDLSSSVANGTTTPVITLNVPTASATNRGALSSTDWSTFNGKESALTFSSPLSRATNTISIPAATTSVNGYLTSTDWTTFNGKFTLPALTNGSVLFSNGTTISQDNANFFWDNTNNRLGIGTATPANNLDVVRGTAGTMARGFYESASVSYNADTKFGIYTASATATDGAALYLGQTNLLNSSSQYGGFELQYRYNSSTTENLRINYVSRLATGAVSTSTSDLLLISKTGAATFLSSVTATSFVKSSGTSAQILAADGSVITAGTNITISGGTISASGGGGTDFYTTNGTLTSDRTITGAGFDLTYANNQNASSQFIVSNNSFGTAASVSTKFQSDTTSGYGTIGKVSSAYTTSAIISTSDFGIINYTAGDIVLLNTFSSGLITFGIGTGLTPLMTLNSAGDLLIGSSTDNGAFKLQVTGGAYIDGVVDLVGISTEPTTPSSGNVYLYSKYIAGKAFVKIKGSSGLDSPLQSSFWQNNITMWSTTISAAGTWIGTTSGTALGTYTTALSTFTNIYTSVKRSRYANVVTTANQVLGQRNSEAMFFRGSIAGAGGFFFYARCGMDAWTNGGRFFAGMCTATTVVSAEPSAHNHSCGFATDSTDAGLIYIQARSATTTTRTSTTKTWAANTGYDMYMFCPPNGTTIYYRIVSINDGSEFSGTITTNLPTNTTGMSVGVMASNAALTTATAIQLGINKIYVETDY